MQNLNTLKMCVWSVCRFSVWHDIFVVVGVVVVAYSATSESIIIIILI